MTTLGKWRRFGEQEDNEEHVMVRILSILGSFHWHYVQEVVKEEDTGGWAEVDPNSEQAEGPMEVSNNHMIITW